MKRESFTLTGVQIPPLQPEHLPHAQGAPSSERNSDP